MGPPKYYTFDFKGKITAKIFLWFRHLSGSFDRLKHFKAVGAVFDLRPQSTVTKRFQLDAMSDLNLQRGGNAVGVAALEVSFFLTFSGAVSRGLSQTASYVQRSVRSPLGTYCCCSQLSGLFLSPARQDLSRAIIKTDRRT
jgi:hypothetical protein